MRVLIDKEGSIDSLKSTIKVFEEDKKISSVLILSCDENFYSSENISQFLQSLNVSIFGAIFPQIIYGKENLSKGNIILGMEELLDPFIIENLSSKAEEIDEELENNFDLSDSTNTMFVFVDGFSTTISTLIDELFNNFGLDQNYIGGGAGSLTFVQKPCIFTNKGLLQDAAVLVATNFNSGIGVKHGWNKISGPYQITKSDKNIVHELDYRPAFEVYKEVVEQHSDKKFSEDNFFDIAKGYPFGISKIGNERIVRDPITVQDNSLLCVGEVTEGNHVDILMGEKESLVNSAKEAYLIAKENYPNQKEEITLLIDCISRVLFLGEDFKEELFVIPDDNLLIGALTLGEIANSGQDYLEFYNKTSVICVL